MATNKVAGGTETLQTMDDEMARRKLIARCAARTAGLEGAPAQRYVRDICDSLLLSRQPQASGAALPLEKAIRLEYLRQLGPWLLVPVLCAALAFSVPNFWVQSLFIAVILLTFGVSVRLAEALSWRRKISHVAGMLPKAETLIRADRDFLTVGTTSVPWDDLALEAVELRYLWRPRLFPKYCIDQLRLTTSKGPLMLDVRLIENGREVIDAICGKLVLR